MTHFYQAHVREPVFLAWTRLWLRLLGEEDVGLSFASAAASTLAVFATYLLGLAVGGPAVGLLAALALAVEFTAITWSPRGWRDDTFMLWVTLTAWRLVRLQERPTPARAALAGIAAAGACLTRLSALTLIVPALGWLAIGAVRRRQAGETKTILLAGLVAVVLVAPYLIACARATGDPFYAVNYHTGYYRHGQGKARDPSATATSFLRETFTARPIETLDTAAQGLFVWPMTSKFTGYRRWHPAIGPALFLLSVAGLVAAVWCARGRLLLVVLFGSLAPYAVTWSTAGGGEWRFTQHAYPLYLCAAAWVIWRAAAFARRPSVAGVSRRAALLAACTLLACAGGWLAYRYAPWLVALERLDRGEPAMITAGRRDASFFGRGWSAAARVGGVPTRIALDAHVTIDVPLAEGRRHTLTLRLDPPERDPARSVTVFVNDVQIGRADLGFSAGRMGSYRFAVPGHAARSSRARLTLASSGLTPARDAGRLFRWVGRDRRVAFRLWYVRLEPEGDPASP